MLPIWRAQEQKALRYARMNMNPPVGVLFIGETEMKILSAESLEKEYSAVAAQCARTGEAQVLAENGRADLVVMDAAAYQRLAAKAGLAASKSRISEKVALEMGVVAAG